MQDNFYRYQQRRLRILLGWGFSNITIGSLMQLSEQGFWKQLGLQAMAWGAIDAALALVGIRSAGQKALRYEQRELGSDDEKKEAHAIQRILLLNAGLDVFYMLGGSWVMWRFQARGDRQGIGVGILLQGTWLFLFDTLLARDVKKRWLS